MWWGDVIKPGHTHTHAFTCFDDSTVRTFFGNVAISRGEGGREMWPSLAFPSWKSLAPLDIEEIEPSVEWGWIALYEGEGVEHFPRTKELLSWKIIITGRRSYWIPRRTDKRKRTAFKVDLQRWGDEYINEKQQKVRDREKEKRKFAPPFQFWKLDPCEKTAAEKFLSFSIRFPPLEKENC